MVFRKSKSSGKEISEAIPSKTSGRKPRVPTRHERPVMGLGGNKDFISNNINESIRTPPRAQSKPEPKPYNSYGTVPKYIVDRKREEAENSDALALAAQAEASKPPAGVSQILAGEELNEMLEHLKKKLDAVTKAHSLILFATTPSQRARKVALEEEIRTLESYIATISKAKALHVLS